MKERKTRRATKTVASVSTAEALTQLRQIGLTDGEVKVYEALLQLGGSTKTQLVKTAGIAPANLYDITNRLANKGLISVIERNGIKNFSAANPNRLLDFLERKREEIDKERTIVQQLLPILSAAHKEHKSGVEFFTGWNGLRTVFDDLLEECTPQDTNYVYGASKGESDDQADIFFTKYSLLRDRKGIPLQIIFNEEVRERKERIAFFLSSKRCKVRFLKQTTPSEILIYKDTAIILILTKEPVAIRIRESNVAISFKQHFDLMWRLSTA